MSQGSANCRLPKLSGVAFAAISAGVLLSLITATAQAQTVTVLHHFQGLQQGGSDGGVPEAGLTMDRAGNLYGTTSSGGTVGTNCNSLGCGTVFQLQHRGSNWTMQQLYKFPGGSNGLVPIGRVSFGPDGSLYGTTTQGGQPHCDENLGCGVVFNLKPPATFCGSISCPWRETILYSFSGGVDGASPASDLAFDQLGNIYGAAPLGGYIGGSGNCQLEGCGVIYKLTPSNGSWTQTVLYTFSGGADGSNPWGGVIADTLGNLYGISTAGGNFDCNPPYGCGTVFQLAHTQSGWTLNTLYTFQHESDGYFPTGGLVFDRSGNLYGSTESGGANSGGTVFKLSYTGGSWMFSQIYALTETNGFGQGGPAGPLTVDASGSLYGATQADGAYNIGSIFKLTPSGGSWAYSNIYDFRGEAGSYPYDGLIVDSNGTIYGTAAYDGHFARGTVFEITP